MAEGVTAIRLIRFGHAVDVMLDRPRRVRVAGTIWAGAYQMRDHIRNVRIDVVDMDSATTAITTPVSIAYTSP